MTKNTNLVHVKVPRGFEPKVKVFYISSKLSWGCDYLLPSDDHIKFRRYLPKKEFNSERKAKQFGLKKRDLLLKGVLSQKEFEKLNRSLLKSDLSFADAVRAYHQITSLNKSKMSIVSELSLIHI